MNGGKDINVPSNDLISRQAAIDAICKCTDIFVTNLPVMVDKADAYKALAELPSAQTERKAGKWIEDAETYYKTVNEKGDGVDENTPFFTEDDIACPVCFAMFSVIDNETERFDFCPSCGAKMETSYE